MSGGNIDINTQLLNRKIELLEGKLIDFFDKESSCWSGRQWMAPSLTAEYLILCKYIGINDIERINAAIKEIENSQNKDGGFSAYYGGKSDPTISAICHLAIQLFTELFDSNTIKASFNFHDSGGRLKNVLLIVKFYYALFDLYPIRRIPKLRPELLLVPRWTRLTFWDMASWARSWFVPLNIIWHYEINKKKNSIKYYSPVDNKRPAFWQLRKRGLIKAYKWLLERQEEDGSWYAVFHSTMISMMAMYNMGYSTETPEMQKALKFIESLHDINNGHLRQMPFLGPIWDSSYALLALSDHNASSEIKNQAIDLLLKKQSNKIADWSYKNKEKKAGGWGFEIQNELHPDNDSTSMLIRSIKKNGREDDQLINGLRWLLSMQNSDGSWAAFNRNCNNILIQWYLKLIRVNIGHGKNLIIDPGSPDLTAHVVQALSEYGYNSQNDVSKKAINWLKKQQKSDGSWFGRWGLCYLYGTASVIEALRDIGEDMDQAYIKKAIRFLKKNQNEDGGFGEAPEAYFDKNYKARGVSTPTQTAWVLSALSASIDHNTPVIKKSVQYLFDNIDEAGNIDEKHYQAVAAPPLYQRYEYYPYYFTLLALKSFRDKLNY